MSAQSDPRRAEAPDVDPKYYYRRSLSARELLPAIGAAVAAAAVTFYLTKIVMERTPLRANVPDAEALPAALRDRGRPEPLRPKRPPAKTLGRR
jgi:hypothetical protein